MTGVMSTLREWINPDWGQHRTVPPLDAGLRANLRLDQEARELLTEPGYLPDDVVFDSHGSILFSSGTAVYEVSGATVTRLADLGGRVGALAADRQGTLAAVDGRGLVWIQRDGAVVDLCTDPLVAQSVTDIATVPDGSVLVTIGSRRYGLDEWAQALVTDDRTGQIVRVADSRAEVVAESLAWPSGIEVAADGEAVLAISLDHRIERRPLDRLGVAGSAVAENLPLYPGRIAAGRTGEFWVAAPYVRNRVTEMLLDEPQLLQEMMDGISPSEWFVPRLRPESPFTDTMQMGQLRVLGVVKSWAPARSCGLVFRIDADGRVIESAHARVDSPRHGLTGVAVKDGDTIVLAVQGYRNVLELPISAGHSEK